LQVVRDRAVASWEDISANIVQLLNGTAPALRLRAIAFLGAFPAFWDRVDAPVRTAVEETAANIDPDAMTDLYVLFAAPLPAFRESILGLIDGLEPAKIMEAIRIAPLDDLWSRALAIYEGSGGFRASEINFRDFILPFAGKMTSARHDALLLAIMRNGQNNNASGTPSLLLTLLENAPSRDFPSTAVREQFVRELQRRRIHVDFDAVIALLQSDGWVAPAAPVEEEGEALF
jgi:hypothetical protein